MFAEAKNYPGGWAYKIESNFGPNDHVPPESIVGAYKVDKKGLLTGEFKLNLNFKKTSRQPSAKSSHATLSMNPIQNSQEKDFS